MANKLKFGTVSSAEAIELENKYGARNYNPLSLVIAKGEGAIVWDPEGNKYFDFLTAFATVNQGHCHPKIINALYEQAKTLTLCSRSVYSNNLGPFEQYVAEYFGYEMVLPLNSGTEAVEAAMKLTRKWGYDKKGIEEGKAILVFADGNFHGRTITIISGSIDPDCRVGFGPFTPGLKVIPYNDPQALEELLAAEGENIAAFIVEPIQGKAGIIVPDEGYLKSCYDICQKYNVLFVADEIQTGLGRTGRLLACDYEDVRPDVLILGKGITGGVYPTSVVLADKEIMLVIKPGQHGSTFGGNPLACAVTKAALEVVKDENLCEKSFELGKIFREELANFHHPMIKTVRGKGLFNAIVVEPKNGIEARDVCVLLKDAGLLCKPTQRHTIRLSPPLVITEAQLREALEIIKKVFNAL